MEVMKKEKHKSYDFKFKLNVVKSAKKIGNRAAAREYNVDEKQVRMWRKQESTLIKCMNEKLQKNEHKTRKRLPGAGRRLISDQLDEIIFYWIIEQREKSLKVSRHDIQEKARELFPILNNKPDQNFKASNGWLQKFMERNHLSLRPKNNNLTTKTTIKENDSNSSNNNLNKKLVNHIINLKKLRVSENILKDDYIIAMNETRIFFEIISHDSKSIKIEDNEKEYVTIVLAAKANGKKLKPYVVFKNSEWDVKLLTQKLTNDEIIIKSSINGWMNQQLINDWLKTIYGQSKLHKRLLIWDSYRYHISTETINELKNYNTHFAIIPIGCTKYIQPADVSWNKLFREIIIKFHENWMSGFMRNESVVYDGSLKVLSKEMILKWIVDAWNLVSSDTIINSFKLCGINVCTEGNEDDLIGCFKSGQPCEEGKELLSEARLGQEEESIEELILEEDLDEIVENEVLIEYDDDDDDTERDIKEEEIILHIDNDSSDSDNC